MQSDGVIFDILNLFDPTEFNLKYLRSTTLGCKDNGIRKSEFVTKTQFLCGTHYTHTNTNIYRFLMKG